MKGYRFTQDGFEKWFDKEHPSRAVSKDSMTMQELKHALCKEAFWAGAIYAEDKINKANNNE